MSSTNDPSSSPPNKYNFYLEIKPFERLRVAIEALCDTKFNKAGSAVLSVDKEGLRITVDTRSSKDYSKPIGVLLLKSKSMVDFQCDESFGDVGISLSEIRKRFPEGCTGDADTICVFNLQESDNIWFHIGTTPPTVFSEKYTTALPYICFPTPYIICSVHLPTKDIREMIDYMSNSKGLINKQVLAELKDNCASFEIGRRKWEYEFEHKGITRTIGLKPEQIYKAWFNWTYTTMEKASSLHTEFGVYFLADPKKHIMLEFCMDEQIDFMLVKKALLCT